MRKIDSLSFKVGKLPPGLRRIVQLHAGLVGGRIRSLRRVAGMLRISYSKVRREYEVALKSLRGLVSG